MIVASSENDLRECDKEYEMSFDSTALKVIWKIEFA